MLDKYEILQNEKLKQFVDSVYVFFLRCRNSEVETVLFGDHVLESKSRLE